MSKKGQDMAKNVKNEQKQQRNTSPPICTKNNDVENFQQKTIAKLIVKQEQFKNLN